ncbi:hypothetical protein EXM36_17005 [Clostridium botulinum]|uniref:hypothetical protein n=1 Tax=Clostridium botulinum TaxID=1491 RepID=UPI0013760188|nr:hypothetical protein [Clostridium botulinum]NCI22120.1 hypothetical protein [Clostridium botulinum]NCI37840.1 hypothetical protein [Clostridium botulinum]NCI74486.1 hypothetical protein [Clostridium botulinum]NDI40961.1 hypothetical protein [Clostridium botulinum]NFA75524.1 hypothetical protein [Clostridium botulinum]
MAKQFVEGNKYVFVAKKYLQWARREGLSVGGWYKSVNGMEVEILNDIDGNCNEYSVGPKWCKCIENNQGRL